MGVLYKLILRHSARRDVYRSVHAAFLNTGSSGYIISCFIPSGVGICCLLRYVDLMDHGWIMAVLSVHRTIGYRWDQSSPIGRAIMEALKSPKTALFPIAATAVRSTMTWLIGARWKELN